MMISKIAKTIAPSLTLALQSKANDMKKQGIPVLNFSAGEPDCDTPQNIKDAAKTALDQGFTKYTNPAGILELRNAICKKLLKENNLSYKPSNIVVSNGAKQCLYNAFLALLNPGDEVIIPAPYWGSYKEMVTLAQGKVVEVDTRQNNFQFKSEDFEDAITKKTKLLILNNPCNPTGALLNPKELKKIAEIAQKNNIYVISDEVYEYFTYGKAKFISFASISKEIKKLTLTINAVSKSYSMTGFRIGYIAGEEEIIDAISAIQSNTTSNACSISQKAALEAFEGSKESVINMVNEFSKRGDYVYKTILDMPGISFIKPDGAFYAFFDVSSYFGENIKTSFDFCNELLKRKNVMLVPGSAFSEYGEGFVRLSYASPFKDIKEGLKRINNFLLSFQ